MYRTITAAEKMRNAIGWLDFQNESFNDRIKTPEDILKLYDYCQKSRYVEFLDDLSHLEPEDRKEVIKGITEILGYNIF